MATTEKEVVECIARIHAGTGTNADWVKVFNFIKPQMIACARKLQRASSDFDECYVDVMEKAWEATQKFDPTRTEKIIPAYLCYMKVVFSNFQVATFKERSQEPQTTDLDAVDENYLADYSRDPVDIVLGKDELTRFMLQLEKLPKLDHDLIVEHVFKQVPYEKLAILFKNQHAGCGEAIRKRILKNLKKIKKGMEDKPCR